MLEIWFSQNERKTLKMNALIVYDSQFGNTERIAQCITSTLSEFGQARAVRVGQVHSEELQGVDMLILGCPTQGMRQTPAMQSFITSIPRELLSGLSVACFDTRFRGGFWKISAAPGMAKQLRTMGDAASPTPPSPPPAPRRTTTVTRLGMGLCKTHTPVSGESPAGKRVIRWPCGRWRTFEMLYYPERSIGVGIN